MLLWNAEFQARYGAQSVQHVLDCNLNPITFRAYLKLIPRTQT